MSARKARSVANPLETAITTPSERILKECHSLYVDSDHGLVKIASSLGVRLLPPRKKIIVMIMGNHSAGKSSFINWYAEEHIQKTGVAIETQGFTFITSGRKRESLTGNATLHLYPHFRPILEFKGVMDYLSAEISTSKQKKFSLVTFLDTPGLVDGDMVYPFDVNSAITWLGEQADLVFVFFDPMGQALCKRTLNIVEKLSEKCGDKLLFYLSKADEAGKETDRQRVMMQIVQELCRRPGLNKCGFEMPTIYIPNPQRQPMRAKHCQTCRQCVRRFDHHCPWMENCVGERNHRWFLVYLLVQLLTLLWALQVALSGISPSGSWEAWLRVNGFLLAALALLGVFSVVVALLLGSHLYLVSINCTTWEFMSRHRISYLKSCGDEENPFDRGFLCNLWDFFCLCRTVAWEQVYSRRRAGPG